MLARRATHPREASTHHRAHERERHHEDFRHHHPRGAEGPPDPRHVETGRQQEDAAREKHSTYRTEELQPDASLLPGGRPAQSYAAPLEDHQPAEEGDEPDDVEEESDSVEIHVRVLGSEGGEHASLVPFASPQPARRMSTTAGLSSSRSSNKLR